VTAIIARQRSTLASALQPFIGSLTTDQWPSAAQTAIDSRIAANRTQLAHVQTSPARSEPAIRTWIASFNRASHAVREAAIAVRRDLDSAEPCSATTD
jgi:hypothetical protein